jgi:predicted amidohydrolase YtcJ
MSTQPQAKPAARKRALYGHAKTAKVRFARASATRVKNFCKRIGVLFFLLAVIACGSGAEVDFARSLAVKAPADLVLRGGKIVTLDGNFSIREAVAIRDRHFITVGSNREMRPLIGPQTRVIELAGRTVIPGLIDGHMNATLAGLSWDAELHWERTRSLAEAMNQVAAATKAKPAGNWILVAGGWTPMQFAEQRFPSRAELDQVAPDHPVYVQYMGEGALLNSTGLRAAGIEPATADPPGGRFEHDPKTRELTGWLKGMAAWKYVYDKIPRLSLDQIRQSLKNCFYELSRSGVTSINDFQPSDVSFAHRRLLSDMARTGDLPLRINFYLIPGASVEVTEYFKTAVDEIKTLAQNENFRFAGFSGPALPGIDDYVLSGAASHSLTRQDEERLRASARSFAESGYNFHLYVGSDERLSRLLDILEQMESSKPLVPRRIGFTGIELATPDILARIKKIGAGITVDDRFALTGDRSAEHSGVEKSRPAPLNTIVQSGIPLGAGTSAFQSGNFSPMLSLWWLITGKTVTGSILRGPSENLTRQQALRAHTIGNAWFTAEEGRKGSIEVDKVADLTVLSADYLTIPEEKIPALESILTIVGGRVVYTAGPYSRIERK